MKSKKLLVFLILLVFIAVLIVVNSTVFTLQNVSVTWMTNTNNLKALNDDELASSIIVRVGGYSARFSTLSQDLKLNIIQRTEY